MSRPAVVPSLDWYKARAVKLVGNVQAPVSYTHLTLPTIYSV